MKKFVTLSTLIALLGTGWFLMADEEYEEREYRRDPGYEQTRDYREKRYKPDEKEYREEERYKRDTLRERGDEDEEDRARSTKRAYKQWRRTPAPPASYLKKPEYAELYRQECAACHMAYQPEFLPIRSWRNMMSDRALQDHFGTDATLEESDRRKIAAFLEANAADSKPVGKHYRKIARSIPAGATPLRISETPYFKKEHREIPPRLITQKEVKSIANCAACHRTAERGYYGEREIIIPNYGRWDD